MLALLLTLSQPAAADTPIRFPGNVGLGVALGVWQNGASVKYFINDRNALEGTLGLYGLGHGYTWLGLSGDYLVEVDSVYDDRLFEVAPCFGGGFQFATGGGDGAFGVHGTAGIELNLEDFPLDVVLEYRPGFYVMPATQVDLFNLGLHVRYYPF